MLDEIESRVNFIKAKAQNLKQQNMAFKHLNQAFFNF